MSCFRIPRETHRGGNGTRLRCSCLENPRDGGAWWAAVCGVAQSRTRLKRLSSSRETQHSSRCWGATSTVVLGARVCLVAQSCPTLCDPVECSPCPPPEDLPNPGIKPRSPALWVDSLPSEPPGKPRSS